MKTKKKSVIDESSDSFIISKIQQQIIVRLTKQIRVFHKQQQQQINRNRRISKIFKLFIIKIIDEKSNNYKNDEHRKYDKYII